MTEVVLDLGSQETALTAPNAPPEPAIVVEHLGRRFGTIAPLRDVSFTVMPGRAIGITGANGSGKTVLLRLLASLDRPTNGRASIYGFDSVRDAREVRRRIGYVPEEPMLYDGITAEQYLHFVGHARGLGRLVREASSATLLQVVGLEGQRTTEVSRFSPGERRRLSLAAALLHEPDVLLMDDPLRALDGQARLEQLEVISELRHLGATLVFTTTRPEDVLESCDELAVLRDGVLVWSGDSAAVERLADPKLAGNVRVRMEVLEGIEPALTLLRQHRDVSELEMDDAAQTIWFLFAGTREGVAGLVPQLVRAGTTLAHFGVERRSAASAVSNLFRAEGA